MFGRGSAKSRRFLESCGRPGRASKLPKSGGPDTPRSATLISGTRVERPPRMSVIIRKENPELVRVIIELKKAAKVHRAPVWRAAADHLTRPRHQVYPLNVGHLERLAEAKETILVPGKLLAAGNLTKPLTIGAVAYSSEARSKVQAAGGTTLTISELLKNYPDGKGVRLLA